MSNAVALGLSAILLALVPGVSRAENGTRDDTPRSSVEPANDDGDDRDVGDADPAHDDGGALEPSALSFEVGGAVSFTSFGPKTFALSDMLHVNRILYAWPELRGGLRYALPANFGLAVEGQLGHTSVGQGNAIVGERLYLLRAAGVGVIDYSADFDGRSLIGGLRFGLATRASVHGGIRALGAVDIGRVSPVFVADVAAGPRIALTWPALTLTFDAFLGYGNEGPTSGAGLGLLWHFTL